MEDTGRVDDEGRAVLERADLMEEFFENVHRSEGSFLFLEGAYILHASNELKKKKKKKKATTCQTLLHHRPYSCRNCEL